jgi:hypothetical protein
MKKSQNMSVWLSKMVLVRERERERVRAEKIIINKQAREKKEERKKERKDSS